MLQAPKIGNVEIEGKTGKKRNVLGQKKSELPSWTDPEKLPTY